MEKQDRDRLNRMGVRCPRCKILLVEANFSCQQCGSNYLDATSRLDFRDAGLRVEMDQAERGDSENRFKNFFKRWPAFYHCLSFIVSPVLFTGLTPEKFLKRYYSEGTIVNLGSGPSCIHKEAINIDVYPFKNVHILASAQSLPFEDGAVDVICCDQVLEHVKNPKEVTVEIQRVVKSHGLIFLGVPFIFPWHPSPRDYTRWSVDGLAECFVDCEILEIGILLGPTSALLVVFSSWFAIALSFGWAPLRKVLQYAFMIICFPFKFLDFIIARIPGAENAAAAVYVVARKR